MPHPEELESHKLGIFYGNQHGLDPEELAGIALR